jgi:hypothetical protein
MATTTTVQSPEVYGKFSNILILLCLCVLAGCADPANVDVQLEIKDPETKITTYTPVLQQLGLMTEIYDTGSVKIQSQNIADNTGSSNHTGGEIQRNITEMVKSTLNSVGGNVIFIEYDPAYISNQSATGYSDFSNKLIPDVVITGGITEFDRGLETRGDGTDFGSNAEFTGFPDWLPSKEVGVRYSDDEKYGKARITLDFNMKNFQTLAGIARMNTVFSIEVGKALGKRELGVTLFGTTFGRKGSIKKVQGRHEAVRILVQASMIQMVGKYLVLPYWRLLGEDAQPDLVVQSALSRSYHSMDSVQRMTLAQEWLYLHGYDVVFSGTLDEATDKALQSFSGEYQQGSGYISPKLFSSLYTTIPVTYDSLNRRQSINAYYASMQQVVPVASPEAQQPVPPPAETVAAPSAQVPAEQNYSDSASTEVTEVQNNVQTGNEKTADVASVTESKVPINNEQGQTAAVPDVTNNQQSLAVVQNGGIASKPDSVPTTLKRRGMSSRGKVGRLLSDDDW